jgi:hypothetical protein
MFARQLFVKNSYTEVLKYQINDLVLILGKHMADGRTGVASTQGVLISWQRTPTRRI